MKPAILTFALICMSAAAQPASIVGKWMGTLQAGAAKLRIGLNVTSTPTGALSATLDSLDQGAMGLPIDSIAVSGGDVQFAAKALGLSYQGKLAANRIEGTLSQNGVNLPLTFEPASNMPAPRRLQEPKHPFPYRSEEVTVTSGDVRLAGTFTSPSSGGPFPAVLLVTGSGPQDRDETLFGHKPFLVLSDYLTRAGIAVLRLDDRGTGKSTGSFKEAGLKEFTSDAVNAVEWLKARKEVNGAKIGIVGHSEGGIVGPLAATATRDVAFVVMMAGPGVPFEQLLREQSAAIMRSAGASDAAIEQSASVQARIFAVLREEPDEAKARQRLQQLVQDLNSKSPQIGELVEAQMATLLSPEIRSAMQYDPAGTLRKLACPVLAVDGSLDLQVSADQNLPAIAAALAAGHNPDYAVEKLPGLNHLFQTAKTGAITEYGQIEETMSPRALKVIADWINTVAR
jgi:fermentation-respiration switch protein FrsA (DUF1100 family)